MLGQYELTEASSDSDCDYWISEITVEAESDKFERYRGWEVVDEEFVLAVEEEAPEEALDAARDEGWEVIRETEANREQIKRVRADVIEETAVYVEDPPEDRYVTVVRNHARDFLEKRGVLERVGRLEDCWYYPERDEFVALYTAVDESGEAAKVAWTASELSETDRQQLLDGEEPGGVNTQTRDINELAKLIDENAPVGTRESEILACHLHGLDGHAEVAEELGDVSRGAISSSAYHLEDKIDGMAWLLVNVISHLPQENRPEVINEMLEGVETGRPIAHDERELDGETLLR